MVGLGLRKNHPYNPIPPIHPLFIFNLIKVILNLLLLPLRIFLVYGQK